jgi:hypothetical protein
MENWESDTAYERVIHYNEKKDAQVRLTVNVFHGVEYIHLREYYMSFDEEWLPSNKGVAMPLDLNNVKQLFIGLAELLADAEVQDVLDAVLGDLYNLTLK